jgi:hypothetical protein
VWTKYDYVCSNCDALIEVTVLDLPEMDPDCVCGNSMVIGIGRSPAFEPVMNVTPREVVKIDSNPYN